MISALGRLGNAVLRSVKGKVWLGTVHTSLIKPEQVNISATSRSGTLSGISRAVPFTQTGRTVTFQVTP
jgi:hypothetical protein